MNHLFADLHVHTSMKPFHSGFDKKKDIYQFIYENTNVCKQLSQLMEAELKDFTKHSQACLKQCHDNNVFLIFNSLYPVEMGWFDILNPVGWTINKERASTCMTNFNTEVIKQKFLEIVKNDSLPINYFDRLTEEYNFVLNNKAPKRILTDYNEYKQLKDNYNKETGIIFCIEGAHSLMNFPQYYNLGNIDFADSNNPDSKPYKIFSSQLKRNIEAMKQWGNGKHCPFYITFSHHYWNILSGHNQSIFGMANMVFNQKHGRDESISRLGMEAITHLLSKDNGRRVLIDIKHLSAKGKLMFYNYRNNLVKDLPIISSHSAVSGDGNFWFLNNYDINLSDLDIQQIFNSGGLIGIMMEKGRLMSDEVRKEVIQLQKNGHNEAAIELYIEMVLANILHIVRVCNSARGWDIVCLGSDFDGMINSLDTFDTVNLYNKLADRLGEILEGNVPILTFSSNHNPAFSSSDINKFKFGLTASDIIEKITCKNIDSFLQRYFHDDYLANKYL